MHSIGLGPYPTISPRQTMCWIAAAVDLLKDRGEGFQVAVNIADDGKHADEAAPREGKTSSRRRLMTGSAWATWDWSESYGQAGSVKSTQAVNHVFGFAAFWKAAVGRRRLLEMPTTHRYKVKIRARKNEK